MITPETLKGWQQALDRQSPGMVLEALAKLPAQEHNAVTVQFEALALARVAGPSEALTRICEREVAGGLRSPKPAAFLLDLAIRLALAAGEWHRVQPWVRQALPFSGFEAQKRLLDFWAMAANQTGQYHDCLKAARMAGVELSSSVHLAALAALELLDQQGSISQDQLLRLSVRHGESCSFWQLLDQHACRCVPAIAPSLHERARPAKPEELTPHMVAALLRLPDLYPDAEARERRLNYLADNVGWLTEQAEKRKLSPEFIASVPFRLAYQIEDHLPIQKSWSNWVTSIMTQVSEPLTEILSDRFTILIITAHWRQCTVFNYFKAHFEGLWGSGLRTLVVALGRTDEVSRKAASHAHAYRELPNQHASIRRVLELVDEYQPHVCLYPEVGMEPVVNALAALRLAPVQACFWGHPASTGLDSMDVYITAAALEDENSANHYSEVVLALPGLGTSFELPAVPVRAQPDHARGRAGPMLVCAQSPFKWQPEFIHAVGRVLKALPNSRLRLFHAVRSISERGLLRCLAHSWAALGVDPRDRVELCSEMSRSNFLATLAECDVALDSFLFSGGQTSVDCLTVGLPPVTLPGRRMRGRQTAAMLKATNLQTCIARDEEDWIAKVIEQATNPALRVELRERALRGATEALTNHAPVLGLLAWLEALRVEMIEQGKSGREAVLAAKLRMGQVGLVS